MPGAGSLSRACNRRSTVSAERKRREVENLGILGPQDLTRAVETGIKAPVLVDEPQPGTVEGSDAPKDIVTHCSLRGFRVYSDPQKLETGLRTISAGIPYI